MPCEIKPRERNGRALLRTIGSLDDLDADDLIAELREAARSNDALIPKRVVNGSRMPISQVVWCSFNFWGSSKMRVSSFQS